MDGEEKFVLSIVAIIACAIILLATSLSYFYTKRMITYVENGYCETTVPGYSDTVMQKCK